MKSLLSLALLALMATGAQAQILTATASVVNAPAPGVKNLKADGTVSIQPGQTLWSVKITRGTITAGVFTPNTPANVVTLNPATVNNVATYSHQFLDALPLGTSSIKVEAYVTKRGPLGFFDLINVSPPPAYASATN